MIVLFVCVAKGFILREHEATQFCSAGLDMFQKTYRVFENVSECRN
jgi:hypothetical protein